MTDEATTLLVELLRADDRDASMSDSLQQVATAQPALAETASTALTTALEAETRQLLEGETQVPDRHPYPADDVSSLSATQAPCFSIETTNLEKLVWALFGLTVAHDEPFQSKSVVDPLEQLSQVADAKLRVHALATLAVVSTRDSEGAVEVALDSIQPKLDSELLVERALAAWSVTELCLHWSTPHGLRGQLRTLLGDPSRFVRLNAAEAVFLSGYRGDDPRFSRSEAYSLIHGAPSLSEAPLRMLAEAGLMAAANRVEGPMYGYATDTIESLYAGHQLVDDIQHGLSELVASSAPEDRAAAAAALGFIGPGFGRYTEIRDRAVPVLNELSDDANATVQATVDWLLRTGPNAWHSTHGGDAGDDQKERTYRVRELDTASTAPASDGEFFETTEYAVIEGCDRIVCRTDAFSLDGDEIRLPQRQRENTGTTVGETVAVESAAPVAATRVTLRLPKDVPAAEFIAWAEETRNEFPTAAVTAGDVFAVDIHPSDVGIDPPTCEDDERAVLTVPLEVVETIPRGPVRVAHRTDLHFDTTASARATDGAVAETELTVSQVSAPKITFGNFIDSTEPDAATAERGENQ